MASLGREGSRAWVIVVKRAKAEGVGGTGGMATLEVARCACDGLVSSGVVGRQVTVAPSLICSG